MDVQSPPLELKRFRALSVLGRGAKGVAFLVRASNQTLALKAISRTLIEKNKNKTTRTGEDECDEGYRRIWLERDVLKSVHHPLLPKLWGFLSTDKIFGFAMEYCSGGDLNSLRKKQTEKMFSDDIIRFYAAELILALEYLHGLGIIYRDLKPENVLIQENGHLMLVDFDLSTRLPSKSPNSPQIPSPNPQNILKSNIPVKTRRFRSFLLCNSGVSSDKSVSPVQNSSDSTSTSGSATELGSGKSNSFVGTEDYVAPEVILAAGHDFAVDWWGLGVVLYEMLYGKTPFRGSNRKETFGRILGKAPDLVGEKTELRDLIGKLLEKDPQKRITCEGTKMHEFFKGIDWDSVLGISRPPFIPMGRLDEEIMEESSKKDIDVEEFVENVFKNDDDEDGGGEIGFRS